MPGMWCRTMFPRLLRDSKYSIDGKIKPVLGAVALSSLTWQQVEDFRDGLLAGMKAASANIVLVLVEAGFEVGCEAGSW